MDVDVPYRLLEYFLEDEDLLLETAAGYRAGTVTTGQMKSLAVETLSQLLLDFQRAREHVSDADIEHYMTARPLMCSSTN